MLRLLAALITVYLAFYASIQAATTIVRAFQ